MNRIIIKTLKLVNFKGVRDLTIDFNEAQTNIYGRNGSGKTTIFDAFTWLLFGKDSSDRKQFDLKTIDKDGNIIPQLPHEVCAVILYNDAEIRLMRRFTEKWVKRAGKVDKEFDGNKEERFINDVPVSKKEYEERIADICREDVFKFITSPTYFTSQKPKHRKPCYIKWLGASQMPKWQQATEILNSCLIQSPANRLQTTNVKSRRRSHTSTLKSQTCPDALTRSSATSRKQKPKLTIGRYLKQN